MTHARSLILATTWPSNWKTLCKKAKTKLDGLIMSSAVAEATIIITVCEMFENPLPVMPPSVPL
jgi:hypothetical protein